jgi:hypothetical protein
MTQDNARLVYSKGLRRPAVIRVKQLTSRHLPPPSDVDARWTLVERIVASPLLSKSSRLCSLLLYITRKTLEGRLDELTETQIGVHVFGRPAGYSSGEDNIVRSHARLLRAKLETYFEQAGDSEELVLTIPKGGYVAAFEPRPRIAVTAEETVYESPRAPLVSPVQSPHRRPKWWMVAVGVSALAAALIAIPKAWRTPRNSAPEQRMSHLLWSRFFQANRNTILVAADSGLVMYENLARRTVHLSEYLGRQYLAAPLPPTPDASATTVRGLAARRYTSLADLNLMTALVRLPEVVPGRLRIRYARDLSVGDFKESNVLLSGAVEANPWLELFDSRMNFQIDDEQSHGVFHVTNKAPAAGEQAEYSYDPHQNPDLAAYSVVAFFSDRFAPTNALIIEGTTVAGTEAAADFVLDDKTITPVLRRALLPDGSLGDFQVLLETRNLAGAAPRAQIVAERVGPPKP